MKIQENLFVLQEVRVIAGEKKKENGTHNLLMEKQAKVIHQ